MHPAQIKAALTIAGFRQTDVAKECGVAPTTIGAVINGRSRSKQVEEWIAEAIGESLEAIWPQWYGEPEKPLTPDERLLLEHFRQMSPAARARIIHDMVGDYVVERSSVQADRGSMAAGRDVMVSEGRKPKRGTKR